LRSLRTLSTCSHFLAQQSFNMAKVRLTYHNGRARGEAIRMILAMGKVDFEDVRLSE